jgi:hypothetical protein
MIRLIEYAIEVCTVHAKFYPIDGTVPMVANVPWEYDTIKGAGPSDFGEISQG